jgi:hypothetical protein
MKKDIKKNCLSCKFSLLNRCTKLKEELRKNGYSEDKKAKERWEIKSKVETTFVCKDYSSIYIEYPIEVSRINTNQNKNKYKDDDVGKFVSILPCGKEYEGKTYLGLYLGELPVSNNISHNNKTKELSISFRNNPAIFVFNLNKIVYGMESWWRIIKNEEDLKQITDKDIESSWYVKALKELSK